MPVTASVRSPNATTVIVRDAPTWRMSTMACESAPWQDGTVSTGCQAALTDGPALSGASATPSRNGEVGRGGSWRFLGRAHTTDTVCRSI